VLATWDDGMDVDVDMNDLFHNILDRTKDGDFSSLCETANLSMDG